jgi:hypothetical protein
MSKREHSLARGMPRPAASGERLQIRLPAEPQVHPDLCRLINDLLAAAGVAERDR